MSRSITLGRFAGIEIGLHWTWLIVFVLIAVSLAAAVFPDQNPGLSSGAYAVMGIVATVLFFGSILLHELGHALQARRDQVEIEGITLWLFGGVAQFKGLYETPGAELRIALAGPAVTAAIAGILLAIITAVPLPAGVDGVLAWLAYINLFLLAFNLIPALPLDGGRVLHAVLWRGKRSLVWATQVGAAIGIGFGYLLVGAGLVLFFAAPAVGGLWLALIGWFLATAARAEAQTLLARQALGSTAVAELMAQRPTTVAPEMTLADFIDDVARRTRFTTYPVAEGVRPIGLLTFAGVVETPRERWPQTRVADRMIPRANVPVVRPDDEAAEALGTVAGSEVRRALVVEDDRLVGLLSISDLARAIQIAAAGDAQTSSTTLARQRPSGLDSSTRRW